MVIVQFEPPNLKLRKKKLSAMQKDTIRGFREYEKVRVI